MRRAATWVACWMALGVVPCCAAAPRTESPTRAATEVRHPNARGSNAKGSAQRGSSAANPRAANPEPVATLAEDEIFEHVTAIEVPLFRHPGDENPMAVVRAGAALHLSDRQEQGLLFVEVPLPVLPKPGAFPNGEPEHLAGWMPLRSNPSAATLAQIARQHPARYGLLRTLALEPGAEPISFTHCGVIREFESDASGQYTRVAAEWPAGAVFGWMPRAEPHETDSSCQALLAGTQTDALPAGYVPLPAQMPPGFERFVAHQNTFYWGSGGVENGERRCVGFRVERETQHTAKLLVGRNELPPTIRSVSLSLTLDRQFPFVSLGCGVTRFQNGSTLASGCAWSYAVTNMDADAVHLFPWTVPSRALGEPKMTLKGYRPDKTLAWYRSRAACLKSSPERDPEPRPSPHVIQTQIDVAPRPAKAQPETKRDEPTQPEARRDEATRPETKRDEPTQLEARRDETAQPGSAIAVEAAASALETLRPDARGGQLTTRQVPVFHARSDTAAVGFLRASVPVTLVGADAEFYRVRASFPVVEDPSGFPKNQVQSLELWLPRRWAPGAPVLAEVPRKTLRQGLVRPLALSAGGEPWTAITCVPFWELESDPSGVYTRVLAEWPSGALLGWMNRVEAGTTDFECKRAVYPEQSSYPHPEEYIGAPAKRPKEIAKWVNSGGTLYWGADSAERRCVAFRFSPQTPLKGRLRAEPKDLPAGQSSATLSYRLHSTLPFITLGCPEGTAPSTATPSAPPCAHDYALILLFKDQFVSLVPWSAPAEATGASSTLAGYDHRTTRRWYLSRQACEDGKPTRDPEPRVHFAPHASPSARGHE